MRAGHIRQRRVPIVRACGVVAVLGECAVYVVRARCVLPASRRVDRGGLFRHADVENAVRRKRQETAGVAIRVVGGAGFQQHLGRHRVRPAALHDGIRDVEVVE